MTKPYQHPIRELPPGPAGIKVHKGRHTKHAEHLLETEHDWHLLDWSRVEEGAGFRFKFLWACPCAAMKVVEVSHLGLDAPSTGKP